MLAIGRAAEKPTSLTESCITSECHAGYTAKKYQHGPVALGFCKFCHRPVDESQHTFKLLRQDGFLCLHCHNDLVVEENTHAPFGRGECLSCHDPHASDQKYLIPTANLSEICYTCHEPFRGKNKFEHHPVAAGKCTLCHNPHGSPHRNLLTSEPGELCFQCHESTEMMKFEHVHEPVKKSCYECHDPHGAENPKILRDNEPSLCYPCHEEVKKEIENAKYPHKITNEDGGCSNCHTPHASTIQFFLKSDPLSLCLSCHDRELKTGRGETIANFRPQVENRKFLHGPVKQKSCNGCHKSHGSQHFRLLIQDYPTEFYASFDVKNYRLCFTCHPEDRILVSETTTLTDFRNGTLNLHHLHVAKPEKGRTCRACHSTHGSDRPRHIREKVPFGEWELPIQFEKTSSGGTCTPGCHAARTYDRENPVIYEKAIQGETTDGKE